MSLTDTQVLRLPKAFANDFSANIKFSKNQLRKMAQLDGVISDLFNFVVDPFEQKIRQKYRDFSSYIHLAKKLEKQIYRNIAMRQR